MGGLRLVRGEIRIAIGIQQTQAGEVTFRSELFGCGSEQEQAFGLLAERLHQFVFRAGRGLAPFEMMRLIHHQ